MKQINNQKTAYRIKRDKRSFSLKFGRYLYLFVIALLFLWIFHLTFSFLYLLDGDGFLTADSEIVAFEYDTSLETILVENGDDVKQGQELFRYDSSDYRLQLVDLLFRQVNLLQDFSETGVHLKKIDAQIASTKKYLGVAKGIVDKIKKLEKRELISNRRRSIEYMRYFDALKEFEDYTAEKGGLSAQHHQIKQKLQMVAKNVTHLVDSFHEGVARAPMDGVVGDLELEPGSVVEKSEPVLRIFSNLRYLLVYFKSSSVSTKLEDIVIVHIPGKGFHFGTVVDRDRVASSIPEEIKPKFRPAERRRAMIVMMDQKVLRASPLMKSIHVYKPMGLESLVALFDIKREHHKEYKAFLKERKKRFEDVRSKHSQSMAALHDKARAIKTFSD